MAGHDSEWTVETLRAYFEREFQLLREHLDERWDAQTTAINTAVNNAQTAINRAEMYTEKRFDSVNAFRAVLSDQQKNMLPRQEYEAAHQDLVERVLSLNDRMNRSEGQSQGVHMSAGVIFASVAALASLVVIVNVVIALVTHA